MMCNTEIDVEMEKKIMKAKEESKVLSRLNGFEESWIEIENKGSLLKLVIYCSFALIMGLIIGILITSVSNGIIDGNIKNMNTNVCIIYSIGLLQLIFTLWNTKRMFIMKFFGLGLLGVIVSEIMGLFKDIFIAISSGVSIDITGLTLNISGCHIYIIVLFVIYSVLLIVNICIILIRIIKDIF